MFLFFCKQKTAYELRISDWSSDVCSSDLNLAKAKYESNPLEDGSLAKWQLLKLNISQATMDAVKPFGLGNKEALRCKNMWTLGLALWMFDRDRAPLIDWLKAKFAKTPEQIGRAHV